MARSGTFLTVKGLIGCRPLKNHNPIGLLLLGIEVTYYEMDNAIRYHRGPESMIFVGTGVRYYHRRKGHSTRLDEDWADIKNDMYRYQYGTDDATLQFKNIYEVQIASTHTEVAQSVSTVRFTLVYVSTIHKKVQNYVTKLDGSWEDMFRTLKYFLRLRAKILA